jgi:preprotein translocase subunit SecY
MILAIYRLGSHVPVPGIDREALAQFFAGLRGVSAGLYDMFSGGNLSNATIFALGIMPYISASIIFQLLQAVVPTSRSWRRKARGPQEDQPVHALRHGGAGADPVLRHELRLEQGSGVVANPGLAFKLMFITLTAGTVFVMWLGEQITERGIGNGISLIIFIGIIASYPSDVLNTFQQLRRPASMHSSWRSCWPSWWW